MYTLYSTYEFGEVWFDQGDGVVNAFLNQFRWHATDAYIGAYKIFIVIYKTVIKRYFIDIKSTNYSQVCILHVLEMLNLVKCNIFKTRNHQLMVETAILPYITNDYAIYLKYMI